MSPPRHHTNCQPIPVSNPQVMALAATSGALFSASVSAGFPSPADDYIERRLDLNELMVDDKEATFFVRVKGDSMREAGLQDDDLLIVDRALPPVNGKIVVAAVNGELTVKYFQRRDGVVRLLPANPAYPALEFKEDDELIIWGVVKGSVRLY